MPITLRVAAATALVSALLLGLFPGLDQEVSRLFFDASIRRFPVAATEWGRALRACGMYLPHAVWIAATVSLLLALVRPARPMPMRPSAAVFLIVIALVVPALIVNAGFKQNWGRPRPVHVAEFGGTQAFKPWWDSSGPCRGSCSFMSGETSAATMLVGAATLAASTVRPLAIGAAALFTLLIGVMRVAFGGHWLSDVLLGGSGSVLLMLGLRRLLLDARGIRDEEARRALAQAGLALRAWTDGARRAIWLGLADVTAAIRLAAGRLSGLRRPGWRMPAAAE
ncbi:phosphatase PAP2 family protein [Ancylobacter sp. IITR112]|uniref:phosphatase PAP2 family protein n=1 Tax=Ancylobacter sp. IITR112 TaxID=3138073 RepID=UPI00352A2C60